MIMGAALWKRIVDDLKQRELMPLKLLFFIHASTLFVLYPYLTIHMRELGIDVEETAVMNAVTPVIAIIMPPLAGMFADRIGNFRIMLSFFSSLGGAASLLLLLVPVGRFSLPYPTLLPLGMGCGEMDPNSISSLQMTLLPDPPCSLLPRINSSVGVTLETCGLVCRTPSAGIDDMLAAPVYRVDVAFEGNKDEHWYAPKHIPEVVEDADPRNLIINKPQYYNQTVRKIADDHIFFPTPTMFNITCLRDICYFMGGDVSFRNATRTTTDSFFSKKYLFHRINGTNDETTVSIYAGGGTGHSVSKRDSSNGTEGVSLHSAMFELRAGNASLRCEDPLALRDISVTLPLLQTTLRSCRPLCLASAPRGALCRDMKLQKIYDPDLTFWCYLGVRVVLGVIGGTAFAMFEGAVIATLREFRADYGLQRIYATIGGMISSPLAGLLIDYASRGKEYTDFRPAFYLYAALKVLGGLLMLTIRLDFKAPAPGVVRDMLRVLRNVELVALLLACFLLGSAWGYLESFLFWLLQDLGGSRSLMGLTITVGGLAGLPLLALSGPIIDALGHANVICIGFLFYAVRLIGYSLLYNPWLCLLFEAMEGFTSSLTFTAVVTYGARLSNASTDSSIQGLLGGIYYGVGKGAGSLIGGFLIKAVGARPTYQLFAVASAGFACAYFLFHKFVTLRRPQRKVNDIMKPRATDPESEPRQDKVAENGKAGADISASSDIALEVTPSAPKAEELQDTKDKDKEITN